MDGTVAHEAQYLRCRQSQFGSSSTPVEIISVEQCSFSRRSSAKLGICTELLPHCPQSCVTSESGWTSMAGAKRTKAGTAV
jgi:hypothetical protein